MNNKFKIVILGICLVATITLAYYASAIEQGYYKMDNSYTINAILDENTISMILLNPAIVSVEPIIMNEGIRGYEIRINPDATDLEDLQVRELLKSIEIKILNNRANTFPYPNVYAEPECHYDYGIGNGSVTYFGEYWVNGQSVKIWGDEKCNYQYP